MFGCQQLAEAVENIKDDVLLLYQSVDKLTAATDQQSTHIQSLQSTILQLSTQITELVKAKTVQQPSPVVTSTVPRPDQLVFLNRSIPDTPVVRLAGITIADDDNSVAGGSGDQDDRPISNLESGRSWILPGFIIRGHAQHPTTVNDYDRKAAQKLKPPRLLKDDSNSLQEYLTSIDLYKQMLYTDVRIAIRTFTIDLDKFYRPMVTAYLSQPLVFWDEFISEFYRQFRDPTSQPKEVDKLHKAVQHQNQRVHQFVTWVKNTASKAGITDSRMLGRIIYKGLLPELLSAAKGSIPENGFTLDGAISWALDAERTLDSIVYAMENRTGTSNSKKRKHTETVEPSIIAPISAQPVKKSQPPQKSKGGSKQQQGE